MEEIIKMTFNIAQSNLFRKFCIAFLKARQPNEKILIVFHLIYNIYSIYSIYFNYSQLICFCFVQQETARNNYVYNSYMRQKSIIIFKAYEEGDIKDIHIT